MQQCGIMSVAQSCPMFDGLIRFDFHFQTSKVTYKMKAPKDVHEFIDNVKLYLEDFMYYPYDELIVLYPTLEGKMVEVKSNDDIEYLKKTKICFDLATKEVYCNIELLILVEKIKIDDPSNQIIILNRRVDQLSNQMINLEISLRNKIEEKGHSIQKSIRSIVLKHHPLKYSKNEYSFKRRMNSKKAIQNDLFSMGQKSKTNISESSFESQQENINEKSSTILPSISKVNDSTEVNNSSLKSDHTTVIENQSKTSVNKIHSKKDINNLVDMLKEQGFTNDLRNIVILIRFDYDYETALKYLKSNPIP